MNRRLFCTVLPGVASALRLANAATQTQARQRLPLDRDWKFSLGDAQGAGAATFDSSAWRTVEVPHDWSIEGKIDAKNPTGGNGGYFPSGIAWYRRTFTAPTAWQGKRVFVEFEGVYMNATVYVNGHALEMHPFGYTSFTHDLTPHIKQGENALAVRIDHQQQMTSRWYSGAGIYRHVWMHVTEPVHVAHWGVGISTIEANTEQGRVGVKTKLVNESSAPAALTLKTVLYSASGVVAGQASASVSLKPGESIETQQEITVGKPALWSPESPRLYRAVTRVMSGANALDEVTTPFGIRMIEWSAEKGFLLNGAAVKMNGGCVHHDHGPLGAAAFDRAEERRVQLLKQSGFNAIRCSHNPPSPGFLDACDRLGMLVMDESFDCWSRGKNKFDYSVAFKDWWQRDIESMVMRDRNHPSVVMWSIGNEIPERGEPLGAQEAKMIADYLRTLDRTRPVTSALNSVGQWANTDGFFSALDIGSYNYNLASHAADHKRVPERIILCAESFPRATFSDWAMVADFPYIVGNFVWTAWDYLGESGLGRSTMRDVSFTAREAYNAPFPCHGSNCGDLDLCGFPRSTAHYRNILWDRGEKLYLGVRQPVPEGKKMSSTMWGVFPVYPSWTWPGMEGKPVEVEVYSKADTVRLYLDDRLIGEKPTTRAEQFKANFTLPYAPGVLKAVAVQGAKPVAESVLRTVGEPAQIRLTADRAAIRSDGQDLSFITVEVVDAKGQPNPNADQEVTFTLSGPGSIAGVGSGNLYTEEQYQSPQRKLFEGKALIVVRASHKVGAITVVARAPGLKDATIRIQARA
ncbi:MAG: sugar-binding domain-containing protein [Candidatus Solibacter sp.]